MPVSISQFASGGEARWIDFYDYAARLFGGGSLPWLDSAAFMALHGKAQGLLKSGVVGLPLEPIVCAAVAADPAIAEAMRGKSRTTFPLRRLLEQPAVRGAIVALLEPLRAAHPGRPLALLLPSPRAFLALAFRLAFGQAAEIEDDDVGAAAVYLADLLREFASQGVDAAVLVGDGTAAADFEALEPIVNKARDYRWQLGLLDAQRALPLPAGCGLAFLISAALPAAEPGGRLIVYGADGAGAGPSPASGQFRYLRLAADAQPEALLSWLAALR